MKILVACEESQAVTIELRKLGHEAYSCDIEPCSGGHPEWHIQQDVLPLLNGKCYFYTVDGTYHDTVAKWRWDMIIAHPPCTYLSNAATRSYSLRVTPAEKVVSRWEERAKAAIFFMRFVGADCDKIAIENPVGFMNTAYRKPDCIIEPYFFSEKIGDMNYQTKKTCLWLKGLPLLQRTNNFEKPKPIRTYITANGKVKGVQWCDNQSGSNQKERAKNRSKTFKGIAKAMAEQWASECK
ncbi:MAG: DNA cytosine methyltransferase [Clostridia bacterium]|jgi:hypothetical protein|nr:DNA cytosine methyltransferase [Clostridia bacterium]